MAEDDKNAAVELIADLLSNTDLSFAPTQYKDLPQAVRASVDKAMADRNIGATDITKVVKGSYFDDERQLFIVWVHNDDAEVYDAVLVFWADRLVGVDANRSG